MTSLLDSVESEFYSKTNLRESSLTLDLIRFITQQSSEFQPWRWEAKRATRGRYCRFSPKDLEKLTADLLDRGSSSVDFSQEPLGPYRLLVDWGDPLPGSPPYQPKGRILLRLRHEYFRGSAASEQVELWLSVLKGIYERTGAYYGYAHETRDHDALTTVRTPNLSRPRTAAYAPALFWANFFGPELVQGIGQERLEQARCWRREPLPGGGMLLVFSPNPLEFQASRDERSRLYEEWDLERLTMPERPARPEQVTRPPASEPVVDSVEQCREYADLCVRVARDRSHVELDYSEASLSHLDDIIRTGWRVGQTPDQVILVMGCYLGETIIRQLGGQWSWEDPGVGMTQPHVQIGRRHLNVIGRVAKRFRHGESESLSWFFTTVKAPGGMGSQEGASETNP